ncbi:MAG: AAA family ATPase [Gemmatimonas sp.]
MHLISLRLQNFRQHADTFIQFERGLIGIVGTNGAGMSTILEGIAFSLYGAVATRGTKDGIKWNRAGGKASVRVELEFALAGHRYRVSRGLTMAELYQDTGESPIANSLGGVTDQLARILGMTKAEFFMTYFTGQKDLAAMGQLSGPERGKFLSRALGFDKLAAALDFVRERRRALTSEIAGLQLAVPEVGAVERAIVEAEERRSAAHTSMAHAIDRRLAAAGRLAELEPQWKASLVARDRDAALHADLRVLETQRTSAMQTVGTLELELKSIESSRPEYDTLAASLEGAPGWRARLAELDALAAAATAHQQAIGQIRSIDEASARIDASLDALGFEQLELDSANQAVNAAMLLANTENERLQTLRETRTKERADADALLTSLRTQRQQLVERKHQLTAQGADGNCGACGKPLGETWEQALAQAELDILAITEKGLAQKGVVEKLVEVPAYITLAETNAKSAADAFKQAETARISAENRARDHRRLSEELTSLADRRRAVSATLSTEMQAYDAQEHADVRQRVSAFSSDEARCAVLKSQLDRTVSLTSQLAAAQAKKSTADTSIGQVSDQLQELGFNDATHAQLAIDYDEANTKARAADVDASVAEGEYKNATLALDMATKRRAETQVARTKLKDLSADHLRHEEMERAFTTLRSELNAQLRPELSEIASGLLDVLTDGRYTEAHFDENYVLTLVEDGVPKGVISGGEEDLCNLVLRLAISQMIAARAGHAFSLLILDEVFGSLDDSRRANVIELLRALNDRFEQVIVITHIGPVASGMDHIIQVQHDADLGCSIVTNGDGTLMKRGDEALLAAA